MRETRKAIEAPRPERHGRFILDDATRTVKPGNYALPYAEIVDLYRECRRRGWYTE